MDRVSYALAVIVNSIDDVMKKLATPKLYQAFCVHEPCRNDQENNNKLVGEISLDLIIQNPRMTVVAATKLAISMITGDPTRGIEADPLFMKNDPNRDVASRIDGEQIKNIQMLPTSLQELASLPNSRKQNSTVFDNGIFNEKQRAAELAIQQTPTLDPNNPVDLKFIQKKGSTLVGSTYLLHTDKADSLLGELIVSIVEKIAEIFNIKTPASKMSEAVTRALSANNDTDKTDSSINLIAQSRGTMTQTNTMRSLGESGFFLIQI